MLPSFDELFALRLSYSDIYDDEYIIIQNLKIILSTYESNTENINNYLNDFYKHFNIDININDVQQIDISPPQDLDIGNIMMSMINLIPNNNNNIIISDNDIINILNSIISNPPQPLEDVVNILDEKEHEKITKYKLEQKNDMDCTICMGSLDEGEDVAILPCKHLFHDECIDTYLKKYNYICPVCRCEVGKSTQL